MAAVSSTRDAVRVRAAGLMRRACAGAIDLMLLIGLFVALQALASLVVGHGLPRLGQLGPAGLLDAVLAGTPGATTGLLLFIALGGTYLVLLNAGPGQTLGKRLLGIRVIDGYGAPLGLGRSLLRAIALIPSVALAGLGVLWIGFDRERRGLHDRLADTHVVIAGAQVTSPVRSEDNDSTAAAGPSAGPSTQPSTRIGEARS
jgi:uncharacterized RDD family membrane protein YckC